MLELLPWLNLLLLPMFGLVVRISATLARMDAELKAHEQQLQRLDRRVFRA